MNTLLTIAESGHNIIVNVDTIGGADFYTAASLITLNGLTNGLISCTETHPLTGSAADLKTVLAANTAAASVVSSGVALAKSGACSRMEHLA